jgi:hypothetical protein
MERYAPVKLENAIVLVVTVDATKVEVFTDSVWFVEAVMVLPRRELMVKLET